MARICMIAYSQYETDGRIRREAESLARRGDQVDCVCLPLPGSNPREALNGVRLHPLRIRKYRGSSNWTYLRSYVSFFLRAFLRVATLHIKNRYDVIQVHTMPDFLVFAALVPRLMGARVLLDVHDLMPELYMSKFDFGPNHALIKALVWVERASVSFAHKCIAVHQTHLEALVGHGNQAQRFELLLNTPDPAVFARRATRAREGFFRLVYHGTISPRHGLECAVRAAGLAGERIEDLKLTVIGDGDDLDRLIGLTSELGLDGRVEFTRRSVPVDELPDLLADADLGIVSLIPCSFTRYMLPVKLMEYVALGIPVIVTRTATIERYFDESMVEYISGTSPVELAQAIVRLHGDPERRARMIRNADDFTSRYNWDKQKQVYYGLVDSLCAANRRYRA